MHSTPLVVRWGGQPNPSSIGIRRPLSGELLPGEGARVVGFGGSRGWISGVGSSGAPRLHEFLGGGEMIDSLPNSTPTLMKLRTETNPLDDSFPLLERKNFFLQGQRDPDFGDMKRAQGHENERVEIQLYAVYRDGGDNRQVGARRLPPGRFFLRSWSAIRWSGRPYRRIPALVKAGTPDSREKCTSLPRQQHHDVKIFAMANLAFSPSPPSIKIIWLYFLHHVVMETPGLLICFQVLPTFASHY